MDIDTLDSYCFVEVKLYTSLHLNHKLGVMLVCMVKPINYLHIATMYTNTWNCMYSVFLTAVYMFHTIACTGTFSLGG